MNSLAIFKTPQAERHFLDAYAAVLRMWPVPYQTQQVVTRLGETFLVTSGPTQAPPLLLIPGFGASATMWVPMIERLSRDYRAYALDTIGDLGRSRLHRKLSSAADLVVWLEEVIQALGYDRVNLLGFSQGGWIALNFAIHRPQHLKKLVLVSPNAGLVGISPRFMLRLMAMAAFPIPGSVEAWAKYNSKAWDPKNPYFKLIMEQMKAGTGGQNLLRAGIMPNTFTDNELKQMGVDTLLLVGSQEVVNNAPAAIQRAERLFPRIEAKILEGARHMVPFDQPEKTNEFVLRFLADGESLPKIE